MISIPRTALYRIWLGRLEVDPKGITSKRGSHLRALRPADPCCFSRGEARTYARLFNQRMYEQHSEVRAVAVRVRLRYEGEPHSGDWIPA